MFGCDKILYITCLISIERLPNMCYIFNDLNLEAFLNQAMYLYVIHFFGRCVFRKGVAFLYATTSYPV